VEGAKGRYILLQIPLGVRGRPLAVRLRLCAAGGEPSREVNSERWLVVATVVATVVVVVAFVLV